MNTLTFLLYYVFHYRYTYILVYVLIYCFNFVKQVSQISKHKFITEYIMQYKAKGFYVLIM